MIDDFSPLWFEREEIVEQSEYNEAVVSSVKSHTDENSDCNVSLSMDSLLQIAFKGEDSTFSFNSDTFRSDISLNDDIHTIEPSLPAIDLSTPPLFASKDEIIIRDSIENVLKEKSVSELTDDHQLFEPEDPVFNNISVKNLVDVVDLKGEQLTEIEVKLETIKEELEQSSQDLTPEKLEEYRRHLLSNDCEENFTKLVDALNEHRINKPDDDKKRKFSCLRRPVGNKRKRDVGLSVLKNMLTTKAVKPKKRNNHEKRVIQNYHERKRREELREAFNKLAENIPVFICLSKKPSRIKILEEAVAYVGRLKECEEHLIDSKQKLLQKQGEMCKQILKMRNDII
ncbi:hypothetical protein B4U80_13490 [Leptotrombidium deliense]|uniref:BHLH domain-containing protein n=1 Tax=Leptotrombidium deliense TaxID=299467 RepID=A0A443S5J0_9ACAR|nr:hypothetical protein B4U80_13490 [Leptotrombidium deliense]